MSAHIVSVLAHKFASGELLEVNAGERHDSLQVVHFDAQRRVGFAVVVGDTSSLPLGTLVKLTMPEGNLQLHTVTQAQLNNSMALNELAAEVVSDVVASLFSPASLFDLRHSRLFNF